MCIRPSQVIAEKEGLAIIKQKENLPSDLVVKILYKPCACSEGWVARSPGNSMWSKAEMIKEKRNDN